MLSVHLWWTRSRQEIWAGKIITTWLGDTWRILVGVLGFVSRGSWTKWLAADLSSLSMGGNWCYMRFSILTECRLDGGGDDDDAPSGSSSSSSLVRASDEDDELPLLFPLLF